MLVELYAAVWWLNVPPNLIQRILSAIYGTIWSDPHRFLGWISAFLVNFWLVLFVLGALAVRVLWPVFHAINWTQWFLKQGNRHPLRAIGLVAAGVMFAGAAIGKAFAV